MQIRVIDHEGKMYDLSIKEFFTVQMIRIKLKQEYNLNTDQCYLFRSGQILDDETLLKANSNEPIIIFDRQIFPDMSYPSVDNEFCLDFSRYSDCFVDVSQINSFKKSSENNNNENISNFNNSVNDQRTLQINNDFSYDEQESENSENDSEDNHENCLNETSSHQTTEISYAERYHNLVGQILDAMNMLNITYQTVDQISSQNPDISIFDEDEGSFVENFLRMGIEGFGQILSDSFRSEEQANNEQNRHFDEEESATDEPHSQIEEHSQGRQLEQEYIRLMIENVNLRHQRQQYDRELQRIEEQNRQQQNRQIEELQNQLNQLEDEYRQLTISHNELEQQSERLSQEYQQITEHFREQQSERLSQEYQQLTEQFREQQSERLSQEYQQLTEQFREQQRIHEQEIIDNQNRQNEEIVSHNEEQSSQIEQLDNLSQFVIDRSETEEQNRLNDELNRLEEMFHNLQFDSSTHHPLNNGRPRNNDLHQTLLELERMQSELQMSNSNNETQQHSNENTNTNDADNSIFLEQLRALMNVSSRLQHEEEGEEESIELGVDLNNLSDVNNYIAKGFDPNANLNEDDDIAISQLLQFGYDRVTVIMLYLSCNKDKERVMNLLTSLNE